MKRWICVLAAVLMLAAFVSGCAKAPVFRITGVGCKTNRQLNDDNMWFEDISLVGTINGRETVVPAKQAFSGCKVVGFTGEYKNGSDGQVKTLTVTVEDENGERFDVNISEGSEFEVTNETLPVLVVKK